MPRAQCPLRALWPCAKGRGSQLSAAGLSPQVRKRQRSIDWTCNGVKVSLLLFLSQLVKAVMKRSEGLFSLVLEESVINVQFTTDYHLGPGTPQQQVIETQLSRGAGVERVT